MIDIEPRHLSVMTQGRWLNWRLAISVIPVLGAKKRNFTNLISFEGRLLHKNWPWGHSWSYVWEVASEAMTNIKKAFRKNMSKKRHVSWQKGTFPRLITKVSVSVIELDGYLLNWVIRWKQGSRSSCPWHHLESHGNGDVMSARTIAFSLSMLL